MAERRLQVKHRFIISGGGTGGHIFPAVAIANEIRAREPEAEILFVGAEGKMEMEKVPAAGYEIVGLKIQGIKRSLSISNLMVPFKLFGALRDASRIIKEFKPDAVIGVGGYASGAVLFSAAQKKIPTLIQEQNSFPGITNRILSRKVKRICVAYEGMERFFPAAKIVMTGNPVRSEIVAPGNARNDAFSFFELDSSRFTVLVVGGSLGARSVNSAMVGCVRKLVENGIQVLWQTGKGNAEQAREAVQNLGDGVKVHEFIARMDLAYAVADLVVSRAGAIAVSELCLVKKPCILVPFPFAAEDHQTSNAKALSDNGAAILLRDDLVKEKLGTEILSLYADENRRKSMAESMAKLGRPDAAAQITDEIFNLIATRK
jgi:UDP-N-acetylglucosamine--N-acetylmuramyl-(pentapeptide) pyrophosphoryl-undecaprenol N-acetylglucosamine transferase